MGSFLNSLSSAVTPAGAAVSIGSSLYNLFTNNSRNKENMRFQSQENEKNRAFNREMAELAYQRNLEQWQRENEYNSPSAVRQRLSDAGLNPDLIYGNGAGNMSSATSPQMLPATSSNGVSPSSSPAPSVGNPASDALTMAQVDVLKSQAEKNRADAGLATANTLTENLLRDGKFEYQGVEISSSRQRIEESKANTKLLEKEVSNVQSQIDYRDALIEQIGSSIENMDADTVGKRIDNYFKSPLYTAQILDLKARAHLSYTEANDIARTYVYRVAQMQGLTEYFDAKKWESYASTSNLELQGVGISWQNEILKIDAGTESNMRAAQVSNLYMTGGNAVLQGLGQFLGVQETTTTGKNGKSTKIRVPKLGRGPAAPM